MTDLVVGCPVTSDRAWITARWMSHLAEAVHACGVLATLCFVVSAEPSEFVKELEAEAMGFAGYAFEDVTCRVVAEPPPPPRRTWDLARYRHLAWVRNQLLAEVRDLAPAFFWSLDSDILAHPRCLVAGIANLAGFDALSLQCFLGGENEPNWANIGAGLLRYDRGGVFEADAIMASKLMTPAAYKIDYVAHPWGEDFGWSAACRRAGLRLGHDATYTSAHIMAPDTAGEPDGHHHQQVRAGR